MIDLRMVVSNTGNPDNHLGWIDGFLEQTRERLIHSCKLMSENEFDLYVKLTVNSNREEYENL